MITGVDTSVLLSYYQGRAGVSGGAAASATSGGTGKNPTPPWGAKSTAPQVSALVASTLAGGKFIDENAAKLSVPTASRDYKRLFGLYQGLNALQGLAEQYNVKGVSAARRAELSARFDAGMKEVGAYLDATRFDGFQLAQGLAEASAQTTVGVKRETDVYTTAALHSGSPSAEVDAFQGPTAFDMTLTKLSGTVTTVNFDLAEMGATPRTMGNVTLYLNDKLQAAGAFSRFAVVRTPGAERTTTAGGKTISLGPGPDTYALKLVGVSTETVAFSAPAPAPSVYIGETVGNAAGSKPTASRQLLKYQTDPTAGATNAADGKVFANPLGSEVQATRASVVAPDGSLYVLADVNANTDGQVLKGFTDVALKKYDSAGNLVYTRTLGAAANAAGYALAVSADGSKVAIAGSVTGALDSGDAGADPKAADSFISVFDAEGQQVWSQRRGAAGDDHVDAVSFAADGSLYVTGTASASMNGQAALGGQDAFVQGFALSAPGAAEAYTAKFTVQYGSASLDKTAGVAVNGSSLFVAGMEGGEAVVRRYDLQPSGAPILGAVRNLGALDGGSLAGIGIDQDGAVIVAGSTRNGALSAGAVTTAYGGGQAAFVASLSADLTADGSERLTYYGGDGDLTASAMTVAGGKVYLTGQVTVTPPPGQTSAFDGYAAAIDPDTGAVSWSQTFRGADRMAAPATIAVDTTGASVLDRLGLPRGTIDYTGSQQVTAATSARAGDQFYIRVGSGAAKAVTVEAADTLKTLADKIGRAAGFAAKVEIVNDKGVDRLKITPASVRTPVEIEAGKGGRDALESLGLVEGLVTTTADRNTKDQVKASYSLKMGSALSLSTEGTAKQAQSMMLDALAVIRGIYRDMTAPPAAKAGAGEVPAYLKNQIANYQDALRRLTGS